MTKDLGAYDNIQTFLLDEIPELKEKLEAQFGTCYDLTSEVPEAYPIFEDVLQPMILKLVRSGENDPLLKRIFSFLERMGISDDKQIVNLLWIGILEPLVSDPELIRKAWRHMGQRTRDLAKEVALSCPRTLRRGS